MTTKINSKTLSIFLFIFLWFPIPSVSLAQAAEEPVVYAVLFYSPTCSHCHQVIEDVLKPMVGQHGDQLHILAIDTSQADGQQLYQATIQQYQIPPERRGVPTLIVGEAVLVGSLEIPQEFPAIVEEALQDEGLDWPAIPGLEPTIDSEAAATSPTPNPTLTPPLPQATETEAVAVSPTEPPSSIGTSTSTVRPTATEMTPATPTPLPAAVPLDQTDLPMVTTDAPPHDPVGFALGAIVLLGLVGSLVYGLVMFLVAYFQHPWGNQLALPVANWLMPLLSLAGLGVAGYLAYVEINQVPAVCGPVGACNVVQSSPYARLWGIPIALLGLLFYLMVLGFWIGQQYSRPPVSHLISVGLVSLTVSGTIFSIYLTGLELFVIQAICLWCLSSAIITGSLMILVTVNSLPSSSPEYTAHLQESVQH